MKVLYLSEWYPSEKNAMAGIFVQKHVQAIRAQGGQVKVNTIWLNADIVQLNVITLKLGLVALCLKYIFRIPYIIVEHWSAYLPQNGQFARFPKWRQWLTKVIAENASGIYPVSQILEDNMKNHGLSNAVWGRMENVVDDIFFNKKTIVDDKSRKRLLHVGCFDDKPKNIKGLLRSVKVVAESRKDFVLTLVGTGKDWQTCYDYAQELHFPQGMLEWAGECSPAEVCDYMHNSDAFLFFSRYETASVVICECLASGLPIVSSRAGAIPEIASDESGIFVAVEDETAFASAINYMLDHYKDYDRKKLQESALKFSFDSVGIKLMNIYTEVIANRK